MSREGKQLLALKRENLRLRKELARWENSAQEREEGTRNETEKELSEKIESPTQEKRVKCPKCKGRADRVEFGRFTYRICQDKQDCGHRDKIK